MVRVLTAGRMEHGERFSLLGCPSRGATREASDPTAAFPVARSRRGRPVVVSRARWSVPR